MDRYRDCLSRVASVCSRPAPSTQSCDAAVAQALWNDLKDTGDAAAMNAFADTCAGTPFADIARARARSLSAGSGALTASGAAPEPALTLDQIEGEWTGVAPGWRIEMTIEGSKYRADAYAGGRRLVFRGRINTDMTVVHERFFGGGWYERRLVGRFPTISISNTGGGGAPGFEKVRLTKSP
ncbi:MAG: hypothetical protein AAFW46_03485 [Pseudomonadota bacterium]